MTKDFVLAKNSAVQTADSSHSKQAVFCIVKNRVLQHTVLDIIELTKEGTLKIKAKPGKKETKITGYEEKTILIDVAAPAIDNKANLEVIKFFSKLLKKQVRIKSGLKSKEKILAY